LAKPALARLHCFGVVLVAYIECAERQMPKETPDLQCLSWNIHRGRGEDGVIDARRTVDVLHDEVVGSQTDILMLQEADEERPPHRGFLDIDRIEERTGLVYAHSDKQTRWGEKSHGFLGIICFVRPSIEIQSVILLDMPGHCHRGAVILDVARHGQTLRLISTHLSLSQPLRIVQMRTLGQRLFRLTPRPTVLCGDLNEWRPWGGLAFSRQVLGTKLSGPAPATFPVRRPFLPLDRFLAGNGARVEHAAALDGPGIRMASDHRPLAARIVVDGSG